MRRMVLIPVLSLLSFANCGDDGEPMTASNNHRGDIQFVPVVAPTAATRLPLPDGEDPRASRQRLKARILELHPELADDAALTAALDGKLRSTTIMAVSSQNADIAPLIGQAYELLEIEYREHPERFRPGR